MSNFIPMVSSSPPPLEDGGGGFNDWGDEDDDFGTFATATIENDFQAFSDHDQSSSANQWNNIPDMPPVPPNRDFGKFADFSSFANDSKIDCVQNGDMIPEAMNNDSFSNDSKEGDNEDEDDNSNKSVSMKLPLKMVNDFVNGDNVRKSPVMPCDDSDQQIKMHKSQSDNLDSISSAISAVDSGLCSTDISPVPQSDDGPEDKSQESDLDDFGDFHSDSSVGKEVLRGSTVNREVLEEQGGNIEMMKNENDEDKYIGSSNSNSQVSNRTGPESVKDQAIRTSQLNEGNKHGSGSEWKAHERVSSTSHCGNTDQCTSQSTSSSDTFKDDHSKTEESLCSNTEGERWTTDLDPGTEDRMDTGQSTEETPTTDHCPSMEETTTQISDLAERPTSVTDVEIDSLAAGNVTNIPDTQDGTLDACPDTEEGRLVVDVEDRCLEADPDVVKDTPSVQGQVDIDNRQNCGYIISDETREECRNDRDSSDLIRAGSTIKAVAESSAYEESTEITLKQSEAPACDVAEDDKTFREVDGNKTDCGFTEQSQEMKDSGFVYTDLSSSEEENYEKKEQEPEAKLEENCDISKQTVDNNEEFNVIDNEDWCEDSVSSGSKEVQVTENDDIKPEPSPGSDDEFDDFADFHAASSVSEQEGCVTSDVSVHDQSPPTSDENKSAVQDINNEEDEEFDDFADFHSSNPADLDIHVSTSLPQTISNGNENTSSDFNSGKCNEDGIDDDFDSFANFSTQFPSESSKNNSYTSAVESDETKSGSDGFDAFPSASAADGDDEDEDDWATFQAPPTFDQVGAGSNVNDNEDFGDFEDFEHTGKPESFSPSSVGDFAAFKQPESAVTKPVVKRTSCEVITSCFPESDDQDDCEANKTPLLLDDCFHEDNAPEDKTASGPQIWVKLKSPHSTIQLSKLWTESHSNGKLFTTLRIDTRNILLGHRKPSVPMYAANLTLLEPTKGPTPPSEGKPDTNKLVDTSKVDDKPASQDLPPVQFDWTNSGLTNPLEANSKSLELDFLVVKEAEAVAKMGVFDSELMHGQRDPKAAMQPLENILANLKTNSTMRQARPAENLTPEATKVITSLPNLSFMKTRVLMFPFKQSSDVA